MKTAYTREKMMRKVNCPHCDIAIIGSKSDDFSGFNPDLNDCDIVECPSCSKKFKVKE